MSEERMSERGNSQPCYHLTGCVEVAHEAVLRKRFELMQPVLEAVGNATIKCRLPLPRYMYVTRTCCKGKLHTGRTGQKQSCRLPGDSPQWQHCAGNKVLRTEGEKYGLTIATFNLLN